MIKKIFFLASVTVSLFDSSCEAAIIKMDPSQVLSLDVSKKGISRVSVEGDEINNVLINPVHLQSYIQLDESGHLFVLGNEEEKEAYLSFITASGAVQDVKLTFVSKHPEPVFFQLGTRNMPLDALGSPQKENVRQDLRKVLVGSFEGWNLTKGDVQIRKWESLEAIPEKVFISSNGQRRLIQFSLQGSPKNFPHVSVFQRAQDIALVFSDAYITDKTRLFVVQKTENENIKEVEEKEDENKKQC
ncbi:MAG: type-F conjugative transfer system secretin TraK [Alphaproteobacteria bacterium]|jgi:hypothetical protein